MECMRHSFQNGVILGGRYQTISPLNHGSFGMVFMARDLRTNETVAVKCLTKQAAATEAELDFAFDDKSEELVLHTRLASHPNIVNLIDSFETDAHLYLVLEFCERGDLYEAIRIGHGPLETEHVRCFMLELVDAVAYIHSKGIYHRDIKPENIFLTRSGTMKLGDFGLATTDSWTYEATVGSDRYMSPEQYDSAGAGYSPAQADIWAIGVCLLNILFCRNPFTIPTEEDPLFLDFSRDKQSLFDVFPSMSQDTYEVIVQCMNLDPSKRSLAGLREALLRVVSFTTLDEALDDFCCGDRRVVASSNREPLRTPSIQSPQVDTGAFPWAKALQATPQKHTRQLSAIPDNESYSEDLFSKSGTTADWMSGTAQTPLSSVIDSSLGASMQSLGISQAGLIYDKSAAKISPMAGSLPISMAKPRGQSAMSLVFGRKEAVSKSWSDMWDEDVEAEENARQLQTLKEMNSRTWSQDSKKRQPVVVETAPGDDDDTPRLGLSPATKSASLSTGHGHHEIPSMNPALSSDIDDDLGADGFFFQDSSPRKGQQSQQVTLRYSPPPKRSNNVDKWAALGERRRAYTGGSSSAKSREAGPNKAGHHHHQVGAGLGFDSSYYGNGFSGVSDFYGHSQHSNSNNNITTFSSSPFGHHSPSHQNIVNNNNNNNKWGHINRGGSRDRVVKEGSWNKGRDRDWNWNFDWRKEKRHAFRDVEWVGGWHEAHS